MANQHGSFQARSRMRVVDSMLPVLHQIHVIGAITRHHEIDKEGLYGQALADCTNRLRKNYWGRSTSSWGQRQA